MTLSPLRPTVAVGFDAVLAVDTDSYTVTEDARGRAFVFDMEDAREDVADAIRDALDRPNAVEKLEIEPGYLRVRTAPTGRETADPRDLRRALKRAAAVYNEQHASDPALDGLILDHATGCIGTYTPTDAAEQGPFLDAHAAGDTVPDVGGPVYEYTREDAGERALGDERRFAYCFAYPFDATEMYDTGGPLGPDDPPVRWDDDAVHDALDVAIEKLPAWPGRPENHPRVVIYPGYAVAEYHTTAVANPVEQAERVADALLQYNKYRNVDEDRSDPPERALHPPISFDPPAYIGAADHGTDADEFLDEQGLRDVDGAPVEPEPAEDDVDADADEQGGLGGLNPFSG